MSFRLARRKTIWVPTPLGWSCLLAILGAGIAFWWIDAESFLALNERMPADVLVVEGWIGAEGIEAAAAEFHRGEYRYIVTTSGMIDERWLIHRLSYADLARRKLLASGIPADRVISAPPEETESQRTFQSAVAVWRALQSRGIHPAAINLFTMCAHARRSRLVFAKVNRHEAKVGVIAWIPPFYGPGPWWNSSARADDVIKETTGYVYELLFNSGRRSNSPLGSPVSNSSSRN
jgi:hypothetical protein